MFFIGTAKNEDIVKEHQHTLAQEGPKSGIHSFQESSWSSSETEGHNSKLIMALMSLKDSLKFLSGFQTYLVIPSSEVQTGKPKGMGQLI